jgi:hypothetical protein
LEGAGSIAHIQSSRATLRQRVPVRELIDTCPVADARYA